jgi:hypothetical protein
VTAKQSNNNNGKAKGLQNPYHGVPHFKRTILRVADFVEEVSLAKYTPLPTGCPLASLPSQTTECLPAASRASIIVLTSCPLTLYIFRTALSAVCSENLISVAGLKGLG